MGRFRRHYPLRVSAPQNVSAVRHCRSLWICCLLGCFYCCSIIPCFRFSLRIIGIAIGGLWVLLLGSLLTVASGRLSAEYAYTLKVDEKSDVYSFGVVLLELITGRKPVGEFGDGVDIVLWARKMTGSVKEEVLKIIDLRLPTPPLHELMHIFYVAMLCVEEQSIERPTMREVVQMLAELPRPAPPPSDQGDNSGESPPAAAPAQEEEHVQQQQPPPPPGAPPSLPPDLISI